MHMQQRSDYVNEDYLKKCAYDDARLDGHGDQFQHFNNRLKNLARFVDHTPVEQTIGRFQEWTDKVALTIDQIGNDIPDSELERRRLEAEMQLHLQNVERQLSDKVRHKQQEMSSWQQRFGDSLQTHLVEPPKKNVVWLAGLILILLAVESIANSRFFAETSDLGLLGGTLAAITVSFGNVFVPLILAFFAHRWFYKPDFIKNIGIGIILLFFVWVIGFNYLVAEYREDLLLEVERSTSTLDYVLLFALGMIVGVLSFWKMWTHYDPYHEARKCMNDLKQLRDNFSHSALEPLTRKQQQFNKQLSHVAAIPNEIDRNLQETRVHYSAANDKAIKLANDVIDIYYRHYCVRKVDPDPVRPPAVSPDNAAQFSVGVSPADWELFEIRNLRFRKFIDQDVPNFNEKIREILHMIASLVAKFIEPVLDILNNLAPAPLGSLKAS